MGLQDNYDNIHKINNIQFAIPIFFFQKFPRKDGTVAEL